MKKDKILWLINVAKAIAVKSKDPSTKVGALIVDKDSRIISTGYNGFVKGCDESKMTFEKPLKYNLIIHAEINAILFAKESLDKKIAIVTHGPCENCLKHLLQVGIREIYFDYPGPIPERGDELQKEAIIRLIESCGATVEDYNGKNYIDYIKGI